jgi:hypothetical protein
MKATGETLPFYIGYEILGGGGSLIFFIILLGIFKINLTENVDFVFER